jgi:hypothetical protein
MYIKPILSKIKNDNKNKKIILLLDILILCINYYFISKYSKLQKNVLDTSITLQNKKKIIQTNNFNIHLISIISIFFYILIKRFIVNTNLFSLENNYNIKNIILNNYVFVLLIILNIIIYLPEFNTNIKHINITEILTETKILKENESFNDLKVSNNKEMMTVDEANKLYEKKQKQEQGDKKKKLLESQKLAKENYKYLNEDIKKTNMELNKNYKNDFIPANEFQAGLKDSHIYSKEFIKDSKLKPINIFDINKPENTINKNILHILDDDINNNTKLKWTNKLNKNKNSIESKPIANSYFNFNNGNNGSKYMILDDLESEELNKKNKIKIKNIEKDINNFHESRKYYNTHDTFEIVKNNANKNHIKFVKSSAYSK